MKIFALALLLGLGVAHAAPYLPASDAEVVERLPGRASDPAIRRVDSLRKQLAARPEDIPLRLEIARRYFDLAMAQGDPRYVGYASSALAPLAQSAAGSAEYWLLRGLIEQYTHQFEAALTSLARSAELDPRSAEPRGSSPHRDRSRWSSRPCRRGCVPRRLSPALRTPRRRVASRPPLRGSPCRCGGG